MGTCEEPYLSPSQVEATRVPKAAIARQKLELSVGHHCSVGGLHLRSEPLWAGLLAIVCAAAVSGSMALTVQTPAANQGTSLPAVLPIWMVSPELAQLALRMAAQC
mmetsp:Transcript_22943/g.44626  ORF Transcript_22943/g.44626 Transcript_22943/m.44626 type:complete len:106 (-) Transcript_22943:264-581(-)